MALSSDGRSLAFVAAGPAGRNLLWVRPLDGSPARPLTGTEMASNPFWSPDGRFLAFFARGKLMKIRARRGNPEPICDAESGLGGTWSREGIILFAPGPASPILRVSSAGGRPVPVTRLDSARRQRSHRWPFFLPDGRHFLYLEQRAGAAWESWENTICVGALDGWTRTPLLRANSNVAYAPSFAPPSRGPWQWLKHLASGPGRAAGGHILFWRDNALLARPFDPKTLRLTGEAFRVAAPVQYRTITSAAVFAVSGNGLLVFQEGTAVGPSLLAWFDRGGRQLEVWGTSADYLFPRLSPDGRRAAVDLVDSGTSRRDVWLLDRERRTQSRLTFDPAVASSPSWSPDGSRIVYSSGRKGSGDLYEKLAAGSEEEKLLLESNAQKAPTDWSPDGRSIAFMSTERENEETEKEEKEKETEKRDGRREKEEKRNSDLWILSVADRKAVAYLKTPFNERAGQFSPDGRWIVYSSDESGREEIYVRSFPAAGEKRRISAGGGSLPRWRRDGKEIFYVVSGRQVMSVEVKTASALEMGPPRRLFEVPMAATFYYDVTSDGLHFLAALSVGEEPSISLTLVRDWAAGAASFR
jgi:Tol biopolymer transport system component